MLTVDTSTWKRNFVPPIEQGQDIQFDWAARLSIDIIRQHTKTDDIPGVTDEQLNLYRMAAVEAAERYTGMLLSGQKVVSEPVQGPAALHYPRQHGLLFLETYKPTYKIRLRYPVADGYVYLYGGMHPTDNGVLMVPPGTSTIDVPVRYGLYDISNCCNPCSEHHLNAGMMVTYKAGFTSPNEIPSLVILGCLQFITWTLEHPGDEILTVRNRRDARSEGAQGTNNIAIASGALESWRLVVEDIT